MAGGILALVVALGEKPPSAPGGPLDATLIPNLDELRALARSRSVDDPPICRHYYFTGTLGTAEYVTVTRDFLHCVLVQGAISLEQAAQIAGQLPLSAHLSLPLLQELAEDILGTSVNPDYPKGSYLAEWHRVTGW